MEPNKALQIQAAGCSMFAGGCLLIIGLPFILMVVAAIGSALGF